MSVLAEMIRLNCCWVSTPERALERDSWISSSVSKVLDSKPVFAVMTELHFGSSLSLLILLVAMLQLLLLCLNQ